MNLEDHQYRITFFRNVLFKIKDHSSVKNEEIKTANSEALIKKLFQWCYFHVSSNKILIPWIKKSLTKCRSSPPEVFLEKVVLKICSKFTGEHPYRSAISINWNERSFWKKQFRNSSQKLHKKQIPTFPGSVQCCLIFILCSKHFAQDSR